MEFRHQDFLTSPQEFRILLTARQTLIDGTISRRTHLTQRLYQIIGQKGFQGRAVVD